MRWAFVCAVLLAGCDPAPVVTPDAATGAPCTTDDACDDGLFCNGAETCGEDDRCVPGLDCGGPCDESADRCTAECAEPDADGDGEDSLACGGADCDDSDRARAPGRA